MRRLRPEQILTQNKEPIGISIGSIISLDW